MDILNALYILLYICLRELLPAFCYYYFFRQHLSISTPKLVGLLALSVGCEFGIVLQFKGELAPSWIYACPLLLLFPPALVIIKASMIKKLLVIVFVGLPMVLVQTFSFVFGNQGYWGWQPLELRLLGLVMASLFVLPFVLHFVKQNAQYLIETKVKSVLEIALGIMLLHMVGSIFIYNFNSPRTWELFWGRFFVTLPAFIFAHMIFYLLRQRELHDHLHMEQRYLKKLREEEQLHFEAIYASWQASRRLRHDMRHIALLLKEYAVQRDYDKIKQSLNALKQMVLHD